MKNRSFCKRQTVWTDWLTTEAPRLKIEEDQGPCGNPWPTAGNFPNSILLSVSLPSACLLPHTGPSMLRHRLSWLSFFPCLSRSQKVSDSHSLSLMFGLKLLCTNSLTFSSSVKFKPLSILCVSILCVLTHRCLSFSGIVSPTLWKRSLAVWARPLTT